MPSRWFNAVVVIACLAGVSAARADVIGPPQLKCPNGFPVQQCHGMEFCEITACTTDDQCPSGSTCADQRWCVRDVICGSLPYEPRSLSGI